MVERSYRTLFCGTLVQESALSIGGNDNSSGIDMPLCKNGEGKTILRGEGLAGALIATTRKLYGDIEKFICAEQRRKRAKTEGGDDEKDPPMEKSRWHFFHSHLQNKTSESSELRQGVGIRQDTGATAEGALFEIETLPCGTSWSFLLEVDTFDNGEEGKTAERKAAAALLEWRRGRCWLGRSVARGLGWMTLQDLQALRLTTMAHVDIWPDSCKTPAEVVAELKEKVEVIAARDFEKAFDITASLPISEKRWQYWEIEGTIEVGQSPSGYGLDAISVGGHAANMAIGEWEEEHYLSPPSRSEEKNKELFAPDKTIVLIRDKDGRLQPFIPGSGLRGPWRHALAHWLRSQGKYARDPNNPEHSPAGDVLEKLFGSLTESARLLICDAYLCSDDWQAAWLQHHAEDEFAAGVYSSSKFDRVALIEGTFRWRIVIELAPEEKGSEFKELIKVVENLGKEGHLPIGGGQWRGVGWPTWKITSNLLYRSGEDAECQK